MMSLAIFFSLIALMGVTGRLVSDSHPSRESAKGSQDQTWQDQFWGLLAPGTVGLAVVFWIIVLIGK